MKHIMKSVNLDDEPIKLIKQLLVLNMEGMFSNPILSQWYNPDVYNKIEKLLREEDGLQAIDFLYRDFLRLVQKLKRVRISTDTYEILSRAMECSVISQGLFDITVGPLTDLWDYKHALEPPVKSKIERVLPLVNYNDLELYTFPKTAGLKKSGQSLDLGGIGKGFASDRFMDIFKKYGVTSAFSYFCWNQCKLFIGKE